MEAIQQQATEAIAKLDKIDLNGLVNSITQVANSIKEITGDPAIRATIGSLPRSSCQSRQGAGFDKDCN